MLSWRQEQEMLHGEAGSAVWAAKHQRATDLKGCGALEPLSWEVGSGQG